MLLQHAETTTGDTSAVHSDVPAYAWGVCALTVGLLLSDYVSRQVLNAVFPFIKTAWNLSDTKLGSLSSVVALMVGVLTFPLSVLADRWGRVKSIALMSALWSLATLGSPRITGGCCSRVRSWVLAKPPMAAWALPSC